MFLSFRGTWPWEEVLTMERQILRKLKTRWSCSKPKRIADKLNSTMGMDMELGLAQSQQKVHQSLLQITKQLKIAIITKPLRRILCPEAKKMQPMIEKGTKMSTRIQRATLTSRCQESMNSMTTQKSLHHTLSKTILVLPVTIETFNQKLMIIPQPIKAKIKILKTCYLNLECLSNLPISRNLHNLEHSSKNLNMKKTHITMTKRSAASKKWIGKIKLILWNMILQSWRLAVVVEESLIQIASKSMKIFAIRFFRKNVNNLIHKISDWLTISRRNLWSKVKKYRNKFSKSKRIKRFPNGKLNL